MILYFSGTGNSEYIAKKLSEALDDEALNLFTCIKNGKSETFHSDRPFVLVAPTYSWRVPRFLSEYLSGCTFTGSKEIYVILNYGDSCGNAEKYIRANTKKLGLNFKGLYGIKMPENYLMLFNLDSYEHNRKLIDKAKAKIDEAAAIIKEGKNFPEVKSGFAGKIESSLVNKVFFKFIVSDKKFYYTDKCISCGLCAKECVFNNITYKDGHPVWNGRCTHCASCIAKCQTGAIEYGEKTIGKERYLLSKVYKEKN